MIKKRIKETKIKKAATKSNSLFDYKQYSCKIKRITAFLLAIILVMSSFPVFANWEDGLVIPGQQDTIDDWDNPYDNDYNYDLPFDNPSDNNNTIGNHNIIDVFPTTEEKTEKDNKQTTQNISTNETTFTTDTGSQENGSIENVRLSNNYNSIFKNSTESALFGMSRSQSGSNPYDYLGGNKGSITIVADRLLSNILYYDGGEVAGNIHIAKWIKGDPAALEYPAYCKDPEYHGVAQYPEKQYGIKPAASLTDKQEKVLGVVRSGYPFKSPSELGVQDVDEAYYATLGAMQTALIDGSLDKWSIKSGNEERNTRILNALKTIYNTGMANPYSPPAISVKLAPVSGSEKATADGEWVTNEYSFSTDYPYNYWKLQFADDKILDLIASSTIEVTVDGTKVMPQENINGSWDTIKGFKIPAGKNATIKYKKSVADSTGAKFAMYGSICDVKFEDCFTYLGNSKEGNWQGYCYNAVPYATDTANYLYDTEPTIPDGEDPDKPSTESDGSLVVEKLDWLSKQKVADAVFHIRGVSSSCSHINISVKASNGATLPILGNGASISVNDGVIKLTGIPQGTYEITEISAPPFYDVAVGQNSQSVEVVNDAEVHPKVIFENKPYGKLKIVKTSETDGSPLEGIYFKVVNHTTGFEQTIVTNAQGEAEIENLPEGSYECVELASRMDYIKNETPVIGEVDWGKETTVSITNKPKPSIEILKIDAETSNPISNVAFEITHKNSQQTYSMSTGVDGKITIIGVDEGWFEVKEVTPAEGYIASDEVYEVYAESGKPGSITIKNTKKSGITIEKVDSEGNGLEGVSFNIYRFGENTPIPNSPVTSGKNGIVTLDDINPGHYQVQEINPLEGFLLDTQRYDLVVEEGKNQATKLKIVNKRLPDLTVKKVDANNVDIPLAGAMFEVKEVDGQALQGSPYTTDKNGEFKIENIDLGESQSKKLIITEIKPPENYNLSEPVTQYVTMEPDKDVTLTFKNYKKSGIRIKKTDINGKGLEGVSFNIFHFGENTPIPNSPVTTGKDGTVELNNLTPGHYQVQEAAALTGYMLDTKKYDLIVEEGSDKTTILEIVNKRLPNLTVKKVDAAELDKGLAGAVFEVKEVDGQVLPGSPYTTGADGTFTIEGIDLGTKGSKKLVITEKKAPPGYNLSNPTVQYATMEPDQDILLTFSNAKLPELVIRKIDSQTSKPLAGAVFSVEKLEEPNKGFLTGSPFTTDQNGEIRLPNQGTGSYKIVEQKASQNYIMDAAERIIHLKEGENFTAVFENTKKPSLTVHKVDSITKTPLAGAEFLVTRAVNDSLNGETIEIGKYYSDANGRFSLNFVESGWYRILETHPAAGYQAVNNYYQDVFLKAGEDKEITFENTAKSAIIIRKVDLETGEALPNIRFQVRYLSGATGSEGTIIGTYTTSLNGSVVVAGLKPGVYSIAELQSDSDHILDDTIQTVTLADDNSVVTVEFTNQPKGGLLIKKYDAVTKEPLSDVIFKITNIKGEVVGESNGEYRTDEKGTIYIPRLMGGFVVQEIKTKDGYILDNTAKTIQIDSGKVFSLEFFNQPENSLIIQKLSAEDNTPLAGATIRVTTADDKFIAEETTDESGTFTVSGVEPGKSYKIFEVSAPNGYILDSDVKVVTVQKDKPIKVILYNQPKNSIIIQKLNAGDNTPLAGATIRITTTDDKFIAEETTDETGTFTVSGVEPGKSYKIFEVSAPKGFMLDSDVKVVTVQKDKPTKVVLYNQPKNSIIIQKLNAEDNTPLAGATIRITTADDKFVAEEITDESGIITVNDVEIGKNYKVFEVSAPDGFVLDSSVKIVSVQKDKSNKVIFYNQPKNSIIIQKLNAKDNTPLAGATIRVTTVDDTFVAEEKTDNSGLITISGLIPGKSYKISEVSAPDGFQLDSDVKVVKVQKDKPNKVIFYNQPLISLTIQKLNAATKEPLANARIKVTTVDDKFIAEERTDASGMITVSGLIPGESYKIFETEAPENFILDATVKTIKIKANEPNKIELFNSPFNSLVIKKLDSVTKEPIEGVKVRVSTMEDTLIGEYVTDERGMITITGLKPDKIFKVMEIEAKEGYQIDSTVKFITIKQDEPAIVELFNAPLNSLVIHKMDGTTKESLSDVKIKVTTPEGTLIGEYKTDVEGKIVISGLKPGIVKVQEQSAKEGYLLDDTIHEVKIETGKPAQLDLYNYKKASLIIIKQDATDKKKMLEGAKFKVSQIDGKIVGEYITGENGQCIVPSLSPNWYVVEEVSPPKNYSITSKPQNVQVKANDPTTVIFEDYQNATLRIEKTDKVTGKPIENVEFSITRSDGKTYGKYHTDKRGEINLEYQLPAGTYLVRETQTVKGYALDTNIRKVTLNWGDDKLIEWENYPLASLEIEKTDKESGKPIAGVKFILYDRNNKVVGEYVTDSKGKITLDKMLAGDTNYYLEEKETKEGYIPNMGKQTIQTKWGKTTHIEVENQPIMGYVKIHKTAADNNPITGILKGKGLVGAEFTIYDSDGKKVDVLVTDSMGYAKSEKLRFGDYTMKETKVPLYYLDENETIEFKIEKDGETVEIERENKSTILQTNVEKSGYKEVLAGDTIRYDLFNIQNKSIVPLKNFYLHESIPSDATRITRLFTGTYNQNLNYTIYYKTNKNKEFKILKDNLFSDKMYEIDCTQGLQAGEFVTDIKFEFGVVNVGFREVERPFLYCKVNDNLPNGYQFTNHVEVGGMYEMQKVKTEDNFTTKVFVPKPENRGKLPRTGY